MAYLILFFAGALLCNAVPHLTAALRGEVFPTPFARPRGRGPSSPLANLYWGSANLVVGLALLALQPVSIGFSVEFACLLLGAFVLGLRVTTNFGRARREGTFTSDKADGSGA